MYSFLTFIGKKPKINHLILIIRHFNLLKIYTSLNLFLAPSQANLQLFHIAQIFHNNRTVLCRHCTLSRTPQSNFHRVFHNNAMANLTDNFVQLQLIC